MRKGKLAMFARVKNILCGKCKKVKTGALTLACLLIMHQIISGISPALFEVSAAAGEPQYIYFDNGLSGYDNVYYSVDDGESYTEMIAVTSSSAPEGSMPAGRDNVKYLFVTDKKISSDKPVKFKGVKSGTVADTVVNYDIDAASREWGYKYDNFVWETPEAVDMSTNNCYFAPALAMQYKYTGLKKDDYNNEIHEDFIMPVGMEGHEEKDNVTDTDTLDISKLNYNTKSNFYYNAKFTADDGTVYVVLGSEDTPVSYKKGTYDFTKTTSVEGDSGTTESTEEISFTMEMAGAAANKLRLIPADSGELNVYSVGEVALSAADGTSVEPTLSEPLDDDELICYTFNVTADTEYTLNGESATIYSVKPSYTDNAALEDVIANADSCVIDAPASFASTKSGTNTSRDASAKFTLPAGTVYDLKDSKLELAPGSDIGFTNEYIGRVILNAEAKDQPAKLTIADSADKTINGAEISEKKDYEFLNLDADSYSFKTDNNIYVYSIKAEYKLSKETSGFSFDDDSYEELKKAGFPFTNTSKNSTYNITNFEVTSDGTKALYAENEGHEFSDGTKFSHRITSSGSGSRTVWYISFTLEDAANVTVYINNRGEKRGFIIEREEGSDENNIKETYSTANYYYKSYDLKAGKYYLYGTGGGTYIYGIKVSYADYYEAKPFYGKSGPIYHNNYDNRTFSGYSYPLLGKTGDVRKVNDIGDLSQTGGGEGSYAPGGSGNANTGSADTYRTTATFYDYYSDWELAGKKLTDHKYYYEGADTYQKKIYTEGDKHQSNEGHADYYDVSYAEGTDTLSYALQGDLWNQAIRDYYKDEEAVGGSMYPLYFGSNSYFSGDGRYDAASNKNDETWTWGAGQTKQEISVKDKDYKSNVFLIPNEMEYLNNLFKPLADVKGEDYKNDSIIDKYFYGIAHGLSNSRGVTDLVEGKLVEDVERTNADKTGEKYYTVDLHAKNGSSEKVVPYFNKAFLLGDNEKNAVYGKVYDNVTFDFKLDENDGYYKYNSTEPQYATRLTQFDKNYYMEYTGKGVAKADKGGKVKDPSVKSYEDDDETKPIDYQFYPFNTSDAQKDYYKENLMFGMKLNIPLTTYSSEEHRTGILKFSGDDDVWVYVNNPNNKTKPQTALALDMGGTHTAIGGVIDMQHGYAVAESTYGDNFGLVTGGKPNSTTATRANEEQAAFAVATANGIAATDGYVKITDDVEFFNYVYTTTDGQYKAEIHEDGGSGYYEITVTGKFTRTNDNKSINFGTGGKTVRFALKNIQDVLYGEVGAGSPDTINYSIDICYMERGLNSSNFKLAFKTVPVTTREVEKSWADGNDDPVKVDLYREEVTDATEGSPLSFDDMIIRAASYDGAGKQEKTVTAAKDDIVSVNLNTDINTEYVVFGLNSIPLTKTVYESGVAEGTETSKTSSSVFNKAMGLKLLVDGEEYPIEFVEGEDGESKYIKVPPESSVTLQFKAVESINTCYSDTEETYRVDQAKAWLVECYPLSTANLSYENLTGAEIADITGESGTVFADAADGSDIRFVIIDNRNNKNSPQKWENNLTVCAVDKYAKLDIETTVSKQDKASRHVFYAKDNWYGLLNPPDELTSTKNDLTKVDGEYGVGTPNTGANKRLNMTIKAPGEVNDCFIRMLVDGKNHLDVLTDTAEAKQLTPITFSGTEMNVTTKLVPIAEDITLNELNDWSAKRDMLADIISVGGVDYPFEYYITPETVDALGEKLHEEYLTKYYAIPDDDFDSRILLGPVTKNGAEYYPFVDGNVVSKILIENIPVTDLKLEKEWTVAQQGYLMPIEVQIYRSEEGADGVKTFYKYKRLKFDTPEGYDKDTFFKDAEGVYSGDGTYEGNVYEVLDDGTSYKIGTYTANYTTTTENSPVDGKDYSIQQHSFAFTLENVPYYSEDGTKKYEYYAAEDEDDLNEPLKYTTDKIGVYYTYKTSDDSYLSIPGVDVLVAGEGENVFMYPFHGVYSNEDTDGLYIKVNNWWPEPRPFDLRVVKTEYDNTSPVVGAKFELLSKENGESDDKFTHKADLITDENGVIEYIDEELEPTDERIDHKKLKDITAINKVYMLKEVSVPDGYVLDETPIIFYVDVNIDGTLSFNDITNVYETTRDSSIYTSAEWVEDKIKDGDGNVTDIKYTLTLNLKNKKYYTLPGTGGRGVYGIMLAGGFMMIISLGLLYLRKRREYRA